MQYCKKIYKREKIKSGLVFFMAWQLCESPATIETSLTRVKGRSMASNDEEMEMGTIAWALSF